MEKSIRIGKHEVEVYLGLNRLTHVSLSLSAAYNKNSVMAGSFFIYLLWIYIGFEVWRLNDD